MLFVITGPVGPYFSTGTFQPVSLLADASFVRAWPGGIGDCKAGGCVNLSVMFFCHFKIHGAYMHKLIFCPICFFKLLELL